MSPNPSGWFVAVILLFIGAKMVVDPEDFSVLPENLASGLSNYLQQIRTPLWRDHLRYRWRGNLRVDVSSSKTASRVLGVVILAIGLAIAAVS